MEKFKEQNKPKVVAVEGGPRKVVKRTTNFFGKTTDDVHTVYPFHLLKDGVEHFFEVVSGEERERERKGDAGWTRCFFSLHITLVRVCVSHIHTPTTP